MSWHGEFGGFFVWVFFVLVFVVVSDLFYLSFSSCENERACVCGLLDIVCLTVKYSAFRTYFFM